MWSFPPRPVYRPRSQDKLVGRECREQFGGCQPVGFGSGDASPSSARAPMRPLGAARLDHRGTFR
eukprot:7307694-Pyramimonas_sp.AAC.1